MHEYVKMVFTVPEADADRLRQVAGDAGGGEIGHYSFTSFSSKGTGRFLPKNGANPTIGKVGKLEEVKEERIEITCDKTAYKDIVKVIRDAHPYEEPAIDIYPLLGT